MEKEPAREKQKLPTNTAAQPGGLRRDKRDLQHRGKKTCQGKLPTNTAVQPGGLTLTNPLRAAIRASLSASGDAVLGFSSGLSLRFSKGFSRGVSSGFSSGLSMSDVDAPSHQNHLY